MRTIFTTALFFLLFSVAAFAQDPVYFNYGKTLVKEPSEATYVRQIASMGDTIHVVVDSHLSGQRAYVGFTKKPKNARTEFHYPKHGQYYTYNDFNRVQKIQTFFKGEPEGNQYEYWDDGGIKSWYYIHHEQPTFCNNYFKNGALEDSITYDYSKKKVRVQRLCYHPNGQQERIELLEDNELIKGICYNDRGEEIPCIHYEESPEFPGGSTSLAKYLEKEMKYPAQAARKRIQGRVWVQFSLDEQGQVVDLEIIKGAHLLLNVEALRVISAMPKWKPGKKKGIPTKVTYTIPLNFVFK